MCAQQPHIVWLCVQQLGSSLCCDGAGGRAGGMVGGTRRAGARTTAPSSGRAGGAGTCAAFVVAPMPSMCAEGLQSPVWARRCQTAAMTKGRRLKRPRRYRWRHCAAGPALLLAAARALIIASTGKPRGSGRHCSASPSTGNPTWLLCCVTQSRDGIAECFLICDARPRPALCDGHLAARAGRQAARLMEWGKTI